MANTVKKVDEAVASQNVEQMSEKTVLLREEARKKLVQKFLKEPKVTVTVSPFYRPFFNSNVRVSIQGISVYVPANGRTYSIPKSFAGLLYEAIATVDLREQKRQRMANVQGNRESSAGQLKF